jgi:hypothetical protein
MKPFTRDMREVPGGVSGRNATTILHFCEPALIIYLIKWSVLNSATFGFSDVSGGLAT